MIYSALIIFINLTRFGPPYTTTTTLSLHDRGIPYEEMIYTPDIFLMNPITSPDHPLSGQLGTHLSPAYAYILKF